MTDDVSRSAVIAFRLNAHHLTERVGVGELLEVAGRCGVQNSPPGSALLALHARVRGLTREHVDAAVAGEKSLLETWCMRGAPFLFSTEDAPFFTTGVLPPTEEVMRHFVSGVQPALADLDLSLSETVELTHAEIGEVLSGRQLAINELGAEIATRITRKLPEHRRKTWEREGPYAKGQPLGEGVVHFCLRILSLQGVVCFAPRTGNRAPFVLVREWLGSPIPQIAPAVARAELVRRYLRCYGPSTRKDFAAWVGIGPADTDPWWTLVEEELTQVAFRGTSWVLSEDLDGLRSAPTPKGLRLLPPHDPYTQLRDRDTIVDRELHRELWRTVGDPGAVLVKGEIKGVWRARKRGRELTVAVKTFGALADRERRALLDEAELLSPLRGASSVHLEFGTY